MMSPAVQAATTDAMHLRLLVKLRQPSTDAIAIAEQAAASAGTPVRYVAAVSPQWHAIELDCANPSTCEDAERRLREDTATFELVQRDERKKALAP